MRLGRRLLLGVCTLALSDFGEEAIAQTTLPEVVVRRPKEAPKPSPRETRGATRRPQPAAPQLSPQEAAAAAAAAAVREVNQRNTALNVTRDDVILPKIGTNQYNINREAIVALPQGENTPVERALLQAPGVSQDSAASSYLHVRNEHANVQYRINGILLPEGIQGLGTVLETKFIANMALITGALPAQYGLHTAGLVDITSRTGLSSGGSLNIYGGSRQTFTPYFDYGGTIGKTEYFVTGRYFESGEGIENPAPTLNALHDYTTQEKFFGYASTLLSDSSRLVLISGASVGAFQIPNNPGQSPAFPVAPANSANLNERQFEHNYYNVGAYQATIGNIDMQLAAFSRWSTVHFVPDVIGDLVFNGIASDVYRASFLNGIQEDTAYHIGTAHTLRTGFVTSAEQTQVINSDAVLPVDANGNATLPFFNIVDSNAKTGYLFGAYVQDEWKITDQWTVNAGVRFDQMWQFVDANQFSPRFNVVYKPFANSSTAFHFGYARTFTPPLQIIATPTNVSLFTAVPNSATPSVPVSSPVLPERAHVFDMGVDQEVLPGLTFGIDAYYKKAKDLLDDGQFGAAYVVDGFNYARGENEGVELKAVYQKGNFRAHGNLAWARQIATTIVSNQDLFGPDELAYIATHYIYTDHAQLWTGSAGISYVWQGTRFSADMIYGSGLRAGFANTDHVPAYTQVNVGVSHDFAPPAPWLKPLTLRFDIINLFDEVYQIRNGTGIGVFAPQYGPRRGYFVGLSQKF